MTYVKPTIVFESPVCTMVGDRVNYVTKINFSNGNYYVYQEPWRGGRLFQITDGRSWSYSKVESFPKDVIFTSPGVTVTFKNRILYLGAYGIGTDKIELPPVSNATCK